MVGPNLNECDRYVDLHLSNGKQRIRLLKTLVLAKMILPWSKKIIAKSYKVNGKREIKMMMIRRKSRKYSKNKMEFSRGGVTRPPSQFESYSLSASSKSYSGRSYSAPKPD